MSEPTGSRSLRAQLQEFQGWLDSGGSDKLLTTMRQLVAVGVGIRPELDWIEAQQDQNPLWFLLDDLMDKWEEEQWMQTLFLAGEHEERFVGVLGRVMVVEGAADAIRQALVGLDDAADYPCRHMAHALEHLGRGEYAHAWPPLLIGLEGHIRRHAEQHGVIDAEGRMRGSKPGVEKIYKALEVPHFYERFLQSRVYGGSGNLFRHGSAAAGVERQMTYAAVAVCGWLEFLGHRQAMDALIDKLDASPSLAAAIASAEPELARYLEERLGKVLEDMDESTIDFIRPLFDDVAGGNEPPDDSGD